MLGRQQIAGVPTAIAELFKNAHDAYADRVEADYFFQDGLLVIRDDGVGMTHGDLESRWLTLGTDSKVGRDPPPIDESKSRRPSLGEKGIGRLAIALLGPQVLVLTRASYGNTTDEITAAFINWSVFQYPGITLEEVEIPIRTFTAAALPSRDEIKEMIEEVRRNVTDLRKKIGKEAVKRILDELDEFVIKPDEVLGSLGEPSLFGDNGRGLHFLIQPANDQVQRDIDLDREAGDEVSDLRRQLLGFGNTMIPGVDPPRIQTRFRYWPTNDRDEGDLIEEREFFTPEEFSSADHRIRGRFDANGQWSGNVEIYDQPPIEHVISWSEGSRREAACGPFQIDFAYIQGSKRDSRLPDDAFALMGRKLDRYGGLYIYRDGVRVSSYGSPTEDFLALEVRRLRGAGYYFFSHRRMFGAISISQKTNPGLVDKAGREGLQQNRAYRDFKDILVNFFIQLAADFFRTREEEPGIWERLRNKMQRAEETRKARAEKTKRQRRELQRNHDRFFESTAEDKIGKEVNEIVDDLKAELAARPPEISPVEAARRVQTAESSAHSKLMQLRQSLTIEVRPDLGLTKAQRRDQAAYEAKMAELEQEVFRPAEEEVTTVAGQTLQKLEIPLEIDERVQGLVSDIARDARSQIDEAMRLAKASISRIEEGATELLERVEAEVDEAVHRLESDIRVQLEQNVDAEQLATVRYELTRAVLDNTGEASRRLRHLRVQLDGIKWEEGQGEQAISSLDTTAALEEALLGLEEEAEGNLELVQLGMALETIDHEFRNSVNGIRRSLRRLRRWGKANAQLDALVNEIDGNFTHLDGYLKLFTPLQRRLYRRKIPISGEAIALYLERLFKDQLGESGIKLRATKSFGMSTVVAFPSVLYPVFINLVDNAIFWLSDANEPRIITLDVDGSDMIVRDTGPGVAARDREAIFERGFTRKPGGRGLGLYISREVLRREGLELALASNTKKAGTSFRIVDALVSGKEAQ
jgi:signal transduction histidine kinase